LLKSKSLAAEETLGGALPKRHVILPERHLRLDELAWIGHHLPGHLQESVADVERVAHADALAVLAREEFHHQPLTALGDLRHVARPLDRVGYLDFGVARICHLYHPAASGKARRPPARRRLLVADRQAPI